LVKDGMNIRTKENPFSDMGVFKKIKTQKINGVVVVENNAKRQND